MARQLYDTQPTFRATLDKCDQLLFPSLNRSLLSILFAENESDAALLNETVYTQPALFVIEYALAELWQSWGIHPSAVMGHSVGEYVAACLAGVFTLEDGLKLIAERARLMQQLPSGGGMAAVFTNEEIVAQAIASDMDQLSIAAINGSSNVVISGAEAALAKVLETLSQQGIKSRRLTVSHAFHSPLMETILDDFEQTAASIEYSEPEIGLVSNVTGKLTALQQVTNPRYWRDHIRLPVRFADAMTNLNESGCDIFIEIGPNPTLLSMGQRCLPEGTGTWLPSLRQGKDDWQTLLSSLAQLYAMGADVDWKTFDRDYPRRKLILPTYPFQRERYWVKADTSKRNKHRNKSQQSEHPLLGRRLNNAGIKEVIFESQIGLEGFGFLADHRIHGKLILPSPAYMEMALAAASTYFGRGNHFLKELIIHEALLIPEQDTCTVQTVLTPETEGVSVQIFYEYEGTWHLSASVQVQNATASTFAEEELSAIQARCNEEITVEACYEGLAKLGLDLGERFQGISAVWRTDGEALCRMELPQALSGEADAYRYIHPAFLDSCFHALGAALPEAGTQLLEAYLLLGLEQLSFLERPAAGFWNHIKLRGDLARLGTQETFVADIHLYTDSGQLLAELSGISLKRARPETLFRSLPSRSLDLLYEIEWQPQPAPVQEDRVAPLLPPGEIEERLLSRVDELSKSNQMPLYDEMLPQLDKVGGMYVADALQKLGLSFNPGNVYSTDELIQKLGIVPRQQALFTRLLEMLEDDGILTKAGVGWEILKAPDIAGLDSRWELLTQQYPMFKAELTLIARTTRGLAEALNGRADPLQLMFPGGSTSDAEKLYQDAPVARTYNTLVSEAVSAALQHLPSNGTIRILEIGAGTGGTTSYVLPALPAEQTRYVFTDVSPMFTHQAKSKFNLYDFVEYQVLDISRDPLQQGFDAHSFDLIIAANVLHATPNLQHTLRNVHLLLAPQGELILYEATSKQRFSDLTVGLTEGWWSFADKELRPEYALLTQDKWRQILGETGFVATVTVPGLERGGILSQQTIMITRASDTKYTKTETQMPWLIFADRDQIGERVAAALHGCNQESTLVITGETYKEVDGRHLQINSDRAGDYVRLLQEKPYRGVIYLWTLDNKLSEGLTAAALREAQRQTTGSFLQLAQAMIKTNKTGLWLVTRGAQTINEVAALVEAGQSAVLGLGRTIALEHPELACKRVDLNPQPSDDDIENLLNEILHGDDQEDEIALRDSRRVRRLVRAQSASISPVSFMSDASYLITGGLRGLGLLVAEWMAERGARYLALMGRSGVSAEAQETISRLEQKGVHILTMQADVSNEDEVRKLIAEIKQTLPPLKGVIHSAGVLDDGMLLQQDWLRFEKVMAPKVTGTWHLHQMTRHIPLDFFVMFSSGVSLLGSVGQANHASANAFMDGLAAYRRALGLPAISINWGAWSEIGAAADRRLADTRNVATFSPQEGLKALEWAIQQNIVQVGVLPVNWNDALQPYAPGDEPALFHEIAHQTRRQTKKTEKRIPEVSLIQRLTETIPNKRLPFLMAHIRQQAADVLKTSNVNTIDLYQPLQSMGLDSLMAVELRNKLGEAVGQTLPATLLFEYPTVSDLADYLADKLLISDTKNKSASQAPDMEVSRTDASKEAASLDDLSEDELADMLKAKLGRMDLD